MADYNREAKRRAKEARMDDMEKPMGKTRPGTVRPKKRPDIVDLTPESRGMKPAQMSGRGGCKNF